MAVLVRAVLFHTSIESGRMANLTHELVSMQLAGWHGFYRVACLHPNNCRNYLEDTILCDQLRAVCQIMTSTLG